MKKIVNKCGISLLALILISSTVELQGAGVKAIDKNVAQVSGFLPYFAGNDGHVHVLLGKYQDSISGEVLTSAPVEVSGYADTDGKVDSVIKGYLSNPLKINKSLRVQYTINGTTKTYYLWTVEVNQSDVAGLIQSLKSQPGNDPIPTEIVDVDFYDYIPGTFFGAKVRLGKSEPLFIDFMRSGILEMKVARGFSDLFQQMSKNRSAADANFPTIPQDVRGALIKLGAELNDLQAELFTQQYLAQEGLGL